MAKKSPKHGDVSRKMFEVVNEATGDANEGASFERGGPLVPLHRFTERPGYVLVTLPDAPTTEVPARP